ncbi:MAG TPA: response regulator, partial [Sphingomicrobium sp.]
MIDDMTVFREPIAASLRLAGYETRRAADGLERLGLVRAHRPDVILPYVSMPRTDGLTFLKHLRGDPATAGIRVILQAAHMEKKHVLAAAALGVRGYVLKSRFRLADLLERVRSAGEGADGAPSGAGQPSPASIQTSGNPAAPPAEQPNPLLVTREPAAADGCEGVAGVAMPDDRVGHTSEFGYRSECVAQYGTGSGCVHQAARLNHS